MNDLETYQKAKTGDYIVKIQGATENDGKYTEAYSIGMPLFDWAMKPDGDVKEGGVRDGELIIITGISGQGKTTFAQNIAMSFDSRALPVLFFSYEVGVNNLYAKFKQMGFDDGVVYVPKTIITGNLNWVHEKIKEAKEKFYTKIIFIDHIDFLSASDKRSTDQLRMALRNICQELKTIAIEEKVIIFLMAHVKKVEGREVEMQDIAESGGIYQLADYVFAINRTFKIEPDGSKNFLNEGKIRLLKNRPFGKMPFMRFVMKDSKIIRIDEQRV